MDRKFESRFGAVDKRLEAVDKRFEAVDRRFEIAAEKLDKLEESQVSFRLEVKDSFAGIRDLISTAKMWAIGMYIAMGGTPLYVIARSGKWI